MGNTGDSKRKPMCRSVWLRRQRAKTKHDGSRVSLSTTKGALCQQNDTLEVAENSVPLIELDKFPEDILHHIHSQLPLRDAARAACVSHRFLRSWRRYPNLTFNWEAFGLNMNERTEYGRAKKLVNIIHTILENHSGTGVKTLKLQARPCGSVITSNQLDIWLQAAIKSGIVELAMDLPRDYGLNFNFPCSLLSCAASSLQSLSLSSCAFCSTLTIDCLSNLKKVCLTVVRITDEQLGCLFSCAMSLEKLELSQCDGITFLKIPSHLQQLNFLRVFLCRNLQMIEIYAPKVSTFLFMGPPMKISISNASQMKSMSMNGELYSGMFHYALTKLHSIASNLQTLVLVSSKEVVDMPSQTSKFLHLKHLKIYCAEIKCFDFCSLVSFLKVCPALEHFFLSAGGPYIVPQDSNLEDYSADSSLIRNVPDFHLDRLKKVTIVGFCSSRSLIKLTCQIIEASSSLQRLVMDTTSGYGNSGICENMDRKATMEALRGVEAIKKYVKGKVPSRVSLEVLEPCDRCHIPKLKMSNPRDFGAMRLIPNSQT
ncbi:hypothetical protein U9M48_009766 [Paspalum notatum var. saurae]|uniref:F-box domain-containing protein n=1 Tax=Paspalum notatum var. saurae TaxID=547442 RepID=A0AAQ3SRW8_PASNO